MELFVYFEGWVYWKIFLTPADRSVAVLYRFGYLKFQEPLKVVEVLGESEFYWWKHCFQLLLINEYSNINNFNRDIAQNIARHSFKVEFLYTFSKTLTKFSKSGFLISNVTFSMPSITVTSLPVIRHRIYYRRSLKEKRFWLLIIVWNNGRR